ncbi:hypothetical protein CEUSTIGMA_g1686.t1 [Chlamydomonas eustigma]|uniref:Uncharacterized protein n=1 Tax=Chlamydomonas eustigma TaxID=1157962 RepID=A0A250WTT3_9CHLO|nr:hypothetical protein CEUSTIGMA_g1686.t1 [Chlamydomonas eustigma]|eukprot:GAX74237.1 hypothetical protein CEUSTIGMA_g1686.t1 [Chlamydomonas eustigma]
MLWQARGNLMRRDAVVTREHRLRYYDRQVRLGITFAILWASGGFIALYFKPFVSDVRNNEPKQQWLSLRDNYFSPKMFRSLKESLVDSPLTHARNELTKRTSGQTTGITISFNLDGEHELRERPELKGVFKFLDAVRLKDANAFVVHLLRMEGETTGGGQHSDFSRKGMLPWMKDQDPHSEAGARWDDDLKAYHFPFWRLTYVSYRTSLIFLQVPIDAKGGNFVVLAQRHDNSYDHLGSEPFENTAIHYRGDALNYQSRFTTATRQPLISLSIEQYKVPERYIHRVKRIWSSAPFPWAES